MASDQGEKKTGGTARRGEADRRRGKLRYETKENLAKPSPPEPPFFRVSVFCPPPCSSPAPFFFLIASLPVPPSLPTAASTPKKGSASTRLTDEPF